MKLGRVKGEGIAPLVLKGKGGFTPRVQRGKFCQLQSAGITLNPSQLYPLPILMMMLVFVVAGRQRFNQRLYFHFFGMFISEFNGDRQCDSVALFQRFL